MFFRISRSLLVLATLGISLGGCIKRSYSESSNTSRSGQPQTESERTEETDQFISDAVTALIAGTLSEQCKSIGLEGSQQKRCGDAMVEFAQHLGFRGHVEDRYSSFVFFHKEFLEILNSEEGSTYLDALWKKTDDALVQNQSFNLWDFTLAHFKGDEPKAVKYIATLFQDDGKAQAQLVWLRLRQEADYSLLENVMMNLQRLIDTNKVALYPQGVDSNRGALYHFYVPWYVARKMRYGIEGRDMAFLAPFLFNSLYELRQMYLIAHPDEKVVYGETAASRRKALLQDLKAHLTGPIAPFKIETDPGNFEDMYIGFRGAILGAGGTAKPEARANFSKQFPPDPAGFMRTELPNYTSR